MRQVPQNQDSFRYGLVGSGRLATHLRHYFSSLQIAYQTWSRQEDDVSVTDKLADCSIILLAIADDQIVPFIRQSQFLAEKKFVHFSGSLVTDLAVGAHPLMTFGKDLYDLEKYQSIPFVTDAGKDSFGSLFPELNNPSFALAPELKAKYHALCVLSGNFTTLLWQKFYQELPQSLGLPSQLMWPYFQQVTQNISAEIESALTGPLVRGDQKTIDKNIQSLSDDAYQEVYQAFVHAFEKDKKPNAVGVKTG